MNLTLTAEQNTDRERLGACVVPALVEYEIWDYPITDESLPHVEFRPHADWLAADEPCPTCGPTCAAIHIGSHWCVNGKPIIEIRVPCPHVHDRCCSGLDCIDMDGFRVAAPATVTLLPTINGRSDERPDAPYACVYLGEGITVLVLETGRELRSLRASFDPLPVAGRDWVAVFEDVSA